MYRERVTLGETIDLRPMILTARVIIAIPDTTKRKSEYRAIDPRIAAQLTDPNVKPRLFMECNYVDKWSNSSIMVIDIETKDVYKNVTGSALEIINGTSSYVARMYLKKLKDRSYDTYPDDLTNYDTVLSMIQGELATIKE